MLNRRSGHKDMADIHVYTAKKLGDMAGFPEELAKSFDDEVNGGGRLTKKDGLAVAQTAGAMVCGSRRRCDMYSDTEKEDSYYLYYLLRAFKQKGSIDYEDMPRLFQETCRRKEDYLGQLNRHLEKAIMDLSWKNRFLESRDAVVSQSRELAVILEEFSRQIEEAVDVTSQYERAVRRVLYYQNMVVDHMLTLEYESRCQGASFTAKTSHGKCITTKEAAGHLGQIIGDGEWDVARDSKTIATRRFATIWFIESGRYRVLYGMVKAVKQGEVISEDNYTSCKNTSGQVVTSLSDGMGSGETAWRGSKRVTELTEQLLAIGYLLRSALKLANTILLLVGTEQHPVTIDLCCIDLYIGVLEVMKLGAVATSIIGDDGVELLETVDVPMGVLNPVEPVLLSRKLRENNRIVMVSDGVLDTLPGAEKEQVMKDFPESIPRRTSQDMTEWILEFAASSVESARDDMMALTAGIWKRNQGYG